MDFFVADNQYNFWIFWTSDLVEELSLKHLVSAYPCSRLAVLIVLSLCTLSATHPRRSSHAFRLEKKPKGRGFEERSAVLNCPDIVGQVKQVPLHVLSSVHCVVTSQE